MNKKILVISIIAVFMLLAIAFASTVTSNTQKPPKKESPLFGIRTRRVIREKVGDFIKRFVGESVFFLPFTWIKNRDDSSIRQMLGKISKDETFCNYQTCISGCVVTVYCGTVLCATSYCPPCP